MSHTTHTASTDLTVGPVAKTLITFSLPFMVGTLLQTLYSTVDTIVVGQYMGSTGLSAVSNGSQLMQMIYMLCIGFSNGGQVILSQAKGNGNLHKIKRTVGTMFYSMLGLSILLGLISIVFSENMLDLLNTPAQSYAYAKDYVVICGIGMIFTGLYNLFSAILRGLGDSRHPLIFVAIASGINLVLDVIFIVFLHWGVAGAAWATIIGQAVSVVFSIQYLATHADTLGFVFSLRQMRLHKKELRLSISLGIPMAIQSCAIQVSFLFVSHMVNTLGVSVSAAFGVAQKIRNIPAILTQGLGLGLTSMLGQNLGAHRQDRVSSTVKWGILISGVINLIFGLFFQLCPVLCFRLFTQDADVLAFAVMSMFCIVVELPGKTFMPACNGLVTAQGFITFSFITAFVDAFAGRVFLSWLLGIHWGMGAFGYFLGYTLATYLTAIPGLVYFASGLWKRKMLL